MCIRDSRKSLIHISHAYPVEANVYEFRIWGWVPQELEGLISRAAVLKKLRQWLGVATLASTGFQNEQSGTLWSSPYIDLKGAFVQWRESPKVEDLIKVGGDSS